MIVSRMVKLFLKIIQVLSRTEIVMVVVFSLLSLIYSLWFVYLNLNQHMLNYCAWPWVRIFSSVIFGGFYHPLVTEDEVIMMLMIIIMIC